MVDRVLVTGANGFIGQEVCRALVSSGFHVRGIVRRRSVASLLPDHVEPYTIPTPAAVSDWREAMRGAEVVVHLIGLTHNAAVRRQDQVGAFLRTNVELTHRVLEACKQEGVSRLVYMSSVKAIGERTNPGEDLTEATPCKPADAYGYSKLEAERLIAREATSGLKTTVLRPPLVYGPGVTGNFLRLMKLVKSGCPIPLPSPPNKRSIVFVGNLAHATVTSVQHAGAAGETFIVTDGAPLSSTALVRELAHLMGRPARLLPMPRWVLDAAGRAIGKSADVSKLSDSLVLSSSHFRLRTGWHPPYETSHGLEATVRWFLKRRNSASGGPVQWCG